MKYLEMASLCFILPSDTFEVSAQPEKLEHLWYSRIVPGEAAKN